MAPNGSETVAVPFEIQPLLQGLQGAGCLYTKLGQSEPIMVVDSAGNGIHPPETAQLRVNGLDHALSPVGEGLTAPFRYSDSEVTVEAFNFLDMGVACSSECEGSFHGAKLRVEYRGESRTLAVAVHCGA